jgi:drug/metabolite transporter (DMT)-like permease
MVLSPRFAPALFVVLWATGFIGARMAMPWAEPFSFLAVRFLLAFAILAAFLPILLARRASARGAAHAVISGALLHGVYLGATFLAIDRGLPAGLAAVVMGLQPLITATLAGPLLGETVRARHWAGLMLGFAGVVLVLWPKLNVAAGGVNAFTLTAALVAVLGITAGTLWQKKFVGQVDLLTGTIWQYLGATILMGAGSLLFETRDFVATGELLFAMAWLVVVLSIGAVGLLMYLIREGAIAKVTSLFYLVPGVTALMAWQLFGETLSPMQIGGVVLSALGVALATRN